VCLPRRRGPLAYALRPRREATRKCLESLAPFSPENIMSNYSATSPAKRKRPVAIDRARLFHLPLLATNGVGTRSLRTLKSGCFDLGCGITAYSPMAGRLGRSCNSDKLLEISFAYDRAILRIWPEAIANTNGTRRASARTLKDRGLPISRSSHPNHQSSKGFSSESHREGMLTSTAHK